MKGELPVPGARECGAAVAGKGRGRQSDPSSPWPMAPWAAFAGTRRPRLAPQRPPQPRLVTGASRGAGVPAAPAGCVSRAPGPAGTLPDRIAVRGG